MHESLLEIRDLTVDFATLDGLATVLDQVCMAVQAQETVGLVGETGCGKSLTAKAVLDALPIPPARLRQGHILFRQHDLLSLDADLRRQVTTRHIAYIPQDPMTSLNPTFTIGQQMADLIAWQGRKRVGPLAFLGIRRHARQITSRAIELLERVHIAAPRDLLRRYPMELSGGMRQRVLIALSLIGHPELLIADEPTTALDVTIQKGIVELLAEKVREEHLAVLYITHNLGVARKLCQRIYVMYAGTVVESAPTVTLLEQPKHPYTWGLLQAIPRLTQTAFQGIDGRIPDYVRPPTGCRFHPRCPKAMDVCREVKPALIHIDTTHAVACHLYPEGVA
jgi:oligopeptide/dipeptide ABC transporter ATP-binding protein